MILILCSSSDVELLIIRHAQAEDESLTGKDFDRRLTERGLAQAKALGACLASLGRLPDLVFTSPFLRARDTAKQMCNSAGIPSPQEEAWLGCGMRPETCLDELGTYRGIERVAIVGHQPDLGHLIDFLIGSADGRVRVRKGGLFILRLSPSLRKGCLEAALPVQLLPCLTFSQSD